MSDVRRTTARVSPLDIPGPKAGRPEDVNPRDCTAKSTRCPTPRKVSYQSSYEARSAQGPHWRNSPMRPYLCKCGLWHLGHPTRTGNTFMKAIRMGNTAIRRARR